MKFSSILVPTLSVLVAAAPTPVSLNQPQLPSIESLINSLAVQVKQLTAQINQTLEALPSDIGKVQKNVATTSIEHDLDNITVRFHDVNVQIAAANTQNSLGNLPGDVLGQLNGQPIALAKLVLPIFQELDPTLQSVLTTVDLEQVYTSVQPLMSNELPALVNGLEPLVSGFTEALSPLLAGVGSLLSPVLSDLNL